ncbi:hypothetical protein OsI_12050 [Oryza sativa Indica Group]|uniref:Uncharacterized protein n=1 Tax=Oryza sativa subsp. indica TaxID=39946 RepID=B8AJS8_ORYSI|nr:hypothetical protein OsI_12050 [Oryza sativa Indica Group]
MTRNLHGHLLRGRDLRVGLADHPSNRPLEDGVAEGAALEEEPEPMETTRSAFQYMEGSVMGPIRVFGPGLYGPSPKFLNTPPWALTA